MKLDLITNHDLQTCVEDDASYYTTIDILKPKGMPSRTILLYIYRKAKGVCRLK
jgi:hypothetical protein